MKILNSFGQDWGDNGYFRVENGDVLGMQFCEIYYDFEDLNDEEKQNFSSLMDQVEGYINKIFFE